MNPIEQFLFGVGELAGLLVVIGAIIGLAGLVAVLTPFMRPPEE